MEIYITKYALTSGVLTLNIDEPQQEELRVKGYLFIKIDGYYQTFYAKDLATSKQELENMFEDLRIKKLQSLDKQVKKYSTMKIKFAKEAKPKEHKTNNLQEAFNGIMKL